ncbi:hypothetical protein F4679DRAFT_512123 [Xylaria curta]|nr:hypothetical protein F4679DRAFT_512123 [Xylaria curta]
MPRGSGSIVLCSCLLSCSFFESMSRIELQCGGECCHQHTYSGSLLTPLAVSDLGCLDGIGIQDKTSPGFAHPSIHSQTKMILLVILVDNHIMTNGVSKQGKVQHTRVSKYVPTYLLASLVCLLHTPPPLSRFSPLSYHRLSAFRFLTSDICRQKVRLLDLSLSLALSLPRGYSLCCLVASHKCMYVKRLAVQTTANDEASRTPFV